MGVFRDIAMRLAALRGAVPDVIDGAGHTIYFHPDLVAMDIHGLTTR